MDPVLKQFLSRHQPVHRYREAWGNGDMPLGVSLYLSDELPPAQFISSVRAVVFRGGSVMVVRDYKNEFHLIPGGRREEEEEIEETLQREVLEETGWTLSWFEPLAFAWFHHLGPHPQEYPYPYPDFLWLIYKATAESYHPKSREFGPYELETGFRSVSEVLKLELRTGQRMLLEAALATNGASGAYEASESLWAPE